MTTNAANHMPCAITDGPQSDDETLEVSEQTYDDWRQAQIDDGLVQPLTRIEVFTLDQVAMYKSRGYEAEYHARGGRVFMVNTSLSKVVANNDELPMMLRNQAE